MVIRQRAETGEVTVSVELGGPQPVRFLTSRDRALHDEATATTIALLSLAEALVNLHRVMTRLVAVLESAQAGAKE